MKEYRSNLAVVALVTLCTSLAAAEPRVPTVNGKERGIGPFSVLEVWGSPREMGFAHGYLMAGRILESINRRTAYYLKSGWADFDQVQGGLNGKVQLPERVEEELNGILAGMAAKLGETPILDALDRPLRLSDLKHRNSEDMFRAFACSGFVVWGDAAGEREVIAGRNFDYFRSVGTMDEWFILVRKPAERNKVAAITIPGYIGTFTGISEQGVSVFMHDGSGGRDRRHDGPTVPLALSLMTFLEGAKADEALGQIDGYLKPSSPYPFPYMVRVISPIGAGYAGTPVRVLRVDSEGIGRNPVGQGCSITTNHYLDDEFNPPPNAGNWSKSRYGKLKQRTDQPTFSPIDAWSALGAVAIADDELLTMHSVVVYPTKRELDLAFAYAEGSKVKPATAATPTRITFENLFGND